MKSRLRKVANHVSPSIHNEVNMHLIDPKGERSKKQLATEEFLISKKLLCDLPIVPTSERVYDLVQDIKLGVFEDISPIEEAYDNWDAWKNRTRELLKSKGILS